MCDEMMCVGYGGFLFCCFCVMLMVRVQVKVYMLFN